MTTPDGSIRVILVWDELPNWLINSWSFSLSADPFNKDSFIKGSKRTSLDNGIILRIDPDWFAVAPAIIAERSDIDEMVDRIEASLKDALKQV